MKKLLRDVWFLSFGLAMNVGAMTVCGSGDAQCKQPCEEHSECEGTLLCLNTTRGHLCLPNSCDTCFEDGLTCFTDDSGSYSDGSFFCGNPRCG